jgi:3-oxoacyl-[acyl-carrier-protein] synthase III
MKVGFETVVAYLPAEVLNVNDHYAYLESAIAKLPQPLQERLRSTGPEEVRRLKDVSAAEIMALGAGRKALASSGLNPSDIDGLLIAQTGGKQFMPLLASYVHLNLGLRVDALVRNIVDDNVSILDAAYVAWNYVRSGLCKRVLLVAVAAQIGGEVGFGVDLTDPLARNYGDGAAAAIVSSQNLKCEFLSYHVETYAVKPRPGGTLNGNFGPVRPLANPDLAAKAGVENKNGAYLVLEDPSFGEVAGRKGLFTDSLARALKKAGLDLKDLGTVIAPHIGYLEAGWIEDLEMAGLGAGTLTNLRKKYGNLAVADPLVDLAEFGEDGQIAKDSIVALWTVCPGVQLASLVLRWLVAHGTD